MAILDENEFTEVEGRSYVNPQVALDESNTFIDNLRSTQQANNQQIQTDTYNLGTEVPSNLGGLTGADSYFTSRYQTPQTASAVANLRATAQAAALNQALQNEQAVWQKKYNDAYRKYQKRSYDKANTPSSTTQNSGGDEGSGSVTKTATDGDSSVKYGGSVSGISGYKTIITLDGKVHLIDNETGEETIINPPAGQGNTGIGGMGWSGGATGNGSGGVAGR